MEADHRRTGEQESVVPGIGNIPGPLPLAVDIAVVGPFAVVRKLVPRDARMNQPLRIERGNHARNRRIHLPGPRAAVIRFFADRLRARLVRSEEHTSELQSLMRISYAVFCLKKKKNKKKK